MQICNAAHAHALHILFRWKKQEKKAKTKKKMKNGGNLAWVRIRANEINRTHHFIFLLMDLEHVIPFVAFTLLESCFLRSLRLSWRQPSYTYTLVVGISFFPNTIYVQCSLCWKISKKGTDPVSAACRLKPT
jgi:hypothetical protein